MGGGVYLGKAVGQAEGGGMGGGGIASAMGASDWVITQQQKFYLIGRGGGSGETCIKKFSLFLWS